MAFSYPTSVERRTDCLSMILGDDVAEQHLLGWRLEMGEQDPNNPLVTPEMPWDSGSVFTHGTFALDPIDGLWKAWHSDSTSAAMRWAGGEVSPIDRCAVRFHLQRSRLYGYTWE